MSPATKVSAREKLLQVSLGVIREKGYEATTVDELCAAAHVTKGAFFHHFESKEALAVAAAEHWTAVTGALFAAAPYHKQKDPLDRLLAYVDFRRELLRGDLPDYTCFVGMMVQEVYDSNPKIREACRRSIFGHAATLENDIREARAKYAPGAEWSAEGVALHTQAVLQGAFIVAKAGQDVKHAADSIDHLRRYLEFLFQRRKGHA
jgi:TetR/AcrR family transcriptional repressor of nem operon